MKKLFFAILLGMLLSSFCLAQKDIPPRKILADASDPGPEKMKLLPGFIHKRQNGIDSQPGTITNSEEEITITYDIGHMAGNRVYLSGNEKILWQTNQKLNDSNVQVVRTDDSIFVTFTDLCANFRAKVKTDEQAMKVLFMLLTYNDKADCTEKSRKN